MSVMVYKALKYRTLAGKKLYQNNAWKTLPESAKIWLNGAWHTIGGASTSSVEIPAVPEQSITHDNGTEPSTGTKWYIMPAGRGSMNGTSWANAASGSMIHAILLSCSSGDSVYFAAGDYTTNRIIALPAGVNLYGGFDSATPVWATRNGFTKQTVFTGTGSFGWMDGSSATSGQKVDGFVIRNYSGTITGSNVTLRNSIVNLGTASLPAASHCVFISTTATVPTVEYCNFFFGDTTVSTSADHVNVYGTESARVTASMVWARYCTAINCSASSSYIFGGGSSISNRTTNCTAINCSASYGYIFKGGVTNCTAINCSVSAGNTSQSYIYIFEGGSSISSRTTNCTAINCSASSRYGTVISNIFGSYATNCTAINCSSIAGGSYIFYGNATNCAAINCSANSISNQGNSYIFYGNATNCTAINCSASAGYIFSGSNANTMVKNCLSWNNGGTEYYNYSYATTCAGSVYNANLALTLGTDNTIARFSNTGYAPARGVQDVGDCPSPISDPTGYAAWIAAFGDWHPLANSFLVGRGTADSNVTTDADGVARPNPPTIGAYEPVPTNA